MTDTRSHYLMNGIAGWRTASASNVAFSADGAVLGLQPLPGSIRPLVDAAGSLGGMVSAIGVAVSADDDVYVLDNAACELKRFHRCLGLFKRLPCIGGKGHAPRQLDDPHGIAISSGDLFLADTGNRRVQVFALGSLVLRGIWGPFQATASGSSYTLRPVAPTLVPPATGCKPTWTWSAGTWQPWGVAVSHHHGVFISDYANGLIHCFHHDGRWLFSSDGSGAGLPALVKPTRLAIDQADRIYVIQDGLEYVVVLDCDGKPVARITQPSALTGRFCPVAVGVDVDGNICLSDCLTRKVYFYQPVGDGSWQHGRCCGSAQAFAASITFTRTGAPLLADGTLSVCQLEPAAAFPTSGTYVCGPLDSRTYRCVWHRVVLGGYIPQGASVRVDTFTSESPKSTDEVLSLAPARWATSQIDRTTGCSEWDCLILSAPGRYAWIRLTLAGDGAETAKLEELRVYYPRNSSLEYLPAVYRQDATSADFLGRFLSIFDTIRYRTSQQVTEIARYLDPMATPANPQGVGGTDFLSWLASWFGLSLASSWPTHRRREWVRQAHRMFALRGTPAGLRLAIELATGVTPRILEMFRLRRWLILNQSTLGNCSSVFGEEVMNRLHIGSNSSVGCFRLIDYGDPNMDIFNQYANQFLVIVPRWPGAGDRDLQTLQQVVDMAKPAHTVAQIQWAEPRFRVGIQAFVGVDTVIGQYPLGVIEGKGTLGYDTVLGVPGDQPRSDAAIGRSARVGSTSVVN